MIITGQDLIDSLKVVDDANNTISISKILIKMKMVSKFLKPREQNMKKK